VSERRGVHEVNARTHNPRRAAIGTKQRSAHQGEWPVRLNIRAAGMANSTSPTVMNKKTEVLIGIIMTVPIW
jgi:hypothetical protein